MARKYTKVESVVGIIEKRTQAGETYREIGASLGLIREEVKRNNEVAQLRMQVEPLRNFLYDAGRR